jgi:UDP-N-acetylmuramyl pentapeptide phosphotransferase/UDP-N-acetylglucosamine-1-phosphate transferase
LWGSRLDAADAILAGIILAAAAMCCAAATAALIPLLRWRNVLDRPNERSSHAVPTPRGGGIAVIGAILLAWLGLAAIGRVSSALIPICTGAGLLAVVSWIDDLYGLSPATRVAAQAAAVAVGLVALPREASSLVPWLAPAVYDVMLGFAWLWWVNAFNFMDGIDGIAGSQAATIGGGLLLVTAVGNAVDPSIALLAAAVLGAALSFLIWNWSPARIFLGDVGSVPLGYLTGFLLIGLAGAGHWKAALILPLYFLADATITLGRRLLRGERVWQAHRQHFYQQAVSAGLGHAEIVSRIVVADLLLVACAWIAENGAGALALPAAAIVVTVLLEALGRGR